MSARVDYAFIATDTNGNELAEFQNPRNRYWSRFVSAPGEASFKIRQKDPLAKDTYIGCGQVHLKIKRNNSLIWAGIIDTLRETPYDIEVHASSWEQMLAYQITGYQDTYTNKRIASDIVQPLWNTAKATANSHLASFTSTTIENPYVSATSAAYITITMDYESLLSVFQKLVAVGRANNVSSADFIITPGKDFNFYRNLGSQQNAVSYVLGGQIRDYTLLLDGRLTRNRVIGVGVGTGASLLQSTQANVTSQTTYKLMEEAIPFKDIDTQDTLDKRAKDWLTLYKDPSKVLQITLRPGLIPFDGYSLGDQIKLNIVRGHTNINDAWYRVVGMKVIITNSGAEVINPILNLPRT